MIERFGGVGSYIFDPSKANANEALESIMFVFFLIFAFFLLVPFFTYLTFMSSLEGAPRTYETSWKRLIQIYAYSYACFIPGAVLHVVLAPFVRARWLLTLSLAGMASFFQYKESIDSCKQYLTYNKFVRLAAGLCFANLMFSLLVKYLVSSEI